MKIKIQVKAPDEIYIATKEAVDSFDFGELEGDELDMEKEFKIESLSEDLAKWIEYAENIMLEYDTETKQMKIIKPS